MRQTILEPSLEVTVNTIGLRGSRATGRPFEQVCPIFIPDIMVQKRYVTYNQVHNQCKSKSEQILHNFKPNLMIAIGGGGYVPARILRSFLKQPGGPNIPIQAIGLSLYESLSDTAGAVEAPGTKVTRTQWLDLSSLQMDSLIGKNILIVDEVDDTRTTLEYAVRELEKDVETARRQSGRTEKTNFFVFVLHNKDKPKKGRLPVEMMEQGRYLAAKNTGDVWICYPWEATNIEEHDELAKTQGLSEDDADRKDPEKEGTNERLLGDFSNVAKKA